MSGFSMFFTTLNHCFLRDFACGGLANLNKLVAFQNLMQHLCSLNALLGDLLRQACYSNTLLGYQFNTYGAHSD